MVEYIRRSLAEEAIEEYICRRCEEYNELAGGCISHAMHCPYLSGEEILKPVESEDVQPIRRGHWEDSGNFYFKKCSECGSKWDISITNNYFAHYCPRCGARMDGNTNG